MSMTEENNRKVRDTVSTETVPIFLSSLPKRPQGACGSQESSS